MIARTSLALVAFSTCLLAQSQSERPVFKGGVDLVQLDVSVLDGNRMPMRGLTAADFTVLEDGKPRPVRAFTAVDLPRRATDTDAAWVKRVPPDVATNQVAGQPGRLVVILMDRSIPHEGPTVTARKIALSVVDSLGPGDLAALVSDSGGAPQNFTADRARLIKAITQRDWSTDSDQNPWKQAADPSSFQLEDGRCLCGLCVLDTITRVADAVRDVPDRPKSLFFIGQGIILQRTSPDPKADVGCDRLVRDARAKMLAAIDLSGLVVHALDPKGLFSVGPQTRGSEKNGAPASLGEAQRRQQQQAEMNDVLMNQGTLHVLPDRTGGRTVLNTNTPDAKVPDIFGETDTYYVLGFEPAAPGTSAPRSIEVRVNRKDARVFTQRKYAPLVSSHAATADAPAPSVENALGGLLPAAGVPLGLAVAAFADADQDAATVHVSVDAAGFARAGAVVPLDVTVATVDQTGRPVASVHQTSALDGSRVTTDAASVPDVRTHLALAPGDYEVRVAVTNRESGAVASVFKQIVVPPFATAALSLSDIAVEMTGIAPVTYPQVTLAIAPTTRREFTRVDHVAAFLQVYQGTRRTDPVAAVPVRARIVDAHGRVAQDQTITLAADDFHDRRADCRVTLPVDRLAPGPYLLQLDATLAGQTVERTVRFVTR